MDTTLISREEPVGKYRNGNSLRKSNTFTCHCLISLSRTIHRDMSQEQHPSHTATSPKNWNKKNMESPKFSSIRQAGYSLSLNERDVFSTLLATVALLA